MGGWIFVLPAHKIYNTYSKVSVLSINKPIKFASHPLCLYTSITPCILSLALASNHILLVSLSFSNIFSTPNQSPTPLHIAPMPLPVLPHAFTISSPPQPHSHQPDVKMMKETNIQFTNVNSMSQKECASYKLTRIRRYQKT